MTPKAKRGDLMLMGRLAAVVELLGHSGATGFETAYEDDGPVQWWAGANWGGTRVFSEKFPYPAQAAEDLLSRVMNGGQCGRCGQTAVVGIDTPGHCCFVLVAGDLDDTNTYRYVRTCEDA